MGKVTHHWWCDLVLACRTPFLPKKKKKTNKSIIFCSSLSAQDSLQVFMTAADTVTGSAIKHTALGCIVRVSQGKKKSLFSLANKQQKNSCYDSLFAWQCVAIWAVGWSPKPRVGENSSYFHSRITSRGMLPKSTSSCPPSTGHSGTVLSTFLASLAHQSSCSGWFGEENSTWQTHMSCLYRHRRLNPHQDLHEINVKHLASTWPQPTTGEDLLSGFAKGIVSVRALRQLMHIVVCLLLAGACV